MSVEWQQQDLEISGARLHVARSGTGEKPAVVLVHGLSDSGRCWPQLARDLEGDYDLVLPDARGHGLSARVTPGEAVDMPADLAGVIEALGLDQPVVMGHSMGAATAAALGARFPDLVRALVLEDPPWHPVPEPPALARLTLKQVEAVEISESVASAPPPAGSNPLRRWIGELDGLSIEDIVSRNRAEHPTWPDEVLRRWSEAKTQLDRNFFTRQELHPMEWPDVVDAITCPTLMITSDPDRGGIVTPELGREVVSRNHKIRMVQIDGVGHHIRFEAYDRYRDAVLAFLAEIVS